MNWIESSYSNFVVLSRQFSAHISIELGFRILGNLINCILKSIVWTLKFSIGGEFLNYVRIQMEMQETQLKELWQVRFAVAL